MKSFIISITLATDDAGATITRYFTDGDGLGRICHLAHGHTGQHLY